MPKFRKKPVVIEAEQYLPGKVIDGMQFCDCASKTISHNIDEMPLCACNSPFVETLEGRMHVNPGDWIITGVKGEKYPCKPVIFEATYEAVDDDRV